MEHLTIDEIMEFVSLTKLDEEALQLTYKVNGHICKCKKCLELVRAYRTIYDEFERNLSEKESEVFRAAEKSDEIEGSR